MNKKKTETTEAGGAVYIVKSAVTIVDSVVNQTQFQRKTLSNLFDLLFSNLEPQFTSNEALTFGGAIAIEQHALVKTSTGNLLNNVTAVYDEIK